MDGFNWSGGVPAAMTWAGKAPLHNTELPLGTKHLDIENGNDLSSKTNKDHICAQFKKDRMGDTRLPPPSPNQAFVTISPFEGGTITLPEKFFVTPADPNASRTVPSLAFLIEHPSPPARLGFLRPDRQDRPISSPLRLLFDLGLRSSPKRYLPSQQEHLKGREPYRLAPGTAKALEAGGLTPNDIHAVILSHVHYDHHGDPEDFPSSDFVIGHGAWKVVKEGLPGIASHQIFQSDMFPEDRTTELSDPAGAPWKPLGPFAATLDILGDGSLYLVNSPGHLPGHTNLLARVAPEKWLYLAGDTAHDLRLITGEKEISTWVNEHGNEICIHLDREVAEKSIKAVRRLRELEGDKVEVIIAHDYDWAERNKQNFFPNHL